MSRGQKKSEVVARYRATTSPKGRGCRAVKKQRVRTTSPKGRSCRAVPRDNLSYCKRRGCRAVARQPRISHLSRARPRGLGGRGAGGAGSRRLGSCDAQIHGTFSDPATREGLSRARPCGLGGRDAGRAGPPTTMSVLMLRTSNRQKIGQLLYLRAATPVWLHATHRPLREGTVEHRSLLSL